MRRFLWVQTWASGLLLGESLHGEPSRARLMISSKQQEQEGTLENFYAGPSTQCAHHRGVQAIGPAFTKNTAQHQAFSTVPCRYYGRRDSGRLLGLGRKAAAAGTWAL
jgi:hypothetical protein